MALPPLSEQQQAAVQRLVEVLRPRAEELLQHVAHLLVANPGPNSFGATEFQLRDLLHDAGADFHAAARQSMQIKFTRQQRQHLEREGRRPLPPRST